MVSEIKVITLTWYEFQSVITEHEKRKSEYETIVYRGHASSAWELKPTLARYLGNNIRDIRASRYFAVSQIIQCLILLPKATTSVIN